MRITKMFGLAAVAAMAFLGASSAMANGPTALCKVHETACSTGNLVTSVHAVNVGEDPVLTTEIAGVPFELLCGISLAVASVLGLAQPQVTHLSTLNWSECHTSLGVACIVTTETLGLLNILKTALNLGTLTSTGGTTVRVNCGEAINCVYGGTVTAGIEGALHQTGVGHGMINVNTEVERTAGTCPLHAHWKALYESLEHIYVVE